MFTRIMAMVISAMLLMTVGIAAVSAISMRTQQINSRLEALTKEARDIAYLAARSNTSTAALMAMMPMSMTMPCTKSLTTVAIYPPSTT